MLGFGGAGKLGLSASGLISEEAWPLTTVQIDQHINSCHDDKTEKCERTLRLLPLETCKASRPPGPKLLLRDFLSLVIVLPVAEAPLIASKSAVAFSLSRVALLFGTKAMERRERGRTLAGGSRDAISCSYLNQKTRETLLRSSGISLTGYDTCKPAKQKQRNMNEDGFKTHASLEASTTNTCDG